MTALDPESGKNRPLTTYELAHELADRIASIPGALANEKRRQDIERWLHESIVIPGERRGRTSSLPAAGLRIPHYLGLLAFNRAVTRERFWAAFFYSALATDLEAGEVLGNEDYAGIRLERFLALGLSFITTPAPYATAVSWSVDHRLVAAKDPEVELVIRALTAIPTTDFPTAASGLPPAFFSTSARTDKGTYRQFLCPGSVVYMRRAIRLVLQGGSRVGHTALAEIIETTLVNHAALYFIRGMRVLNALNTERHLGESCANCWDRFQADLRPIGDAERRDRWQADGYQAGAERADVDWIDANCDVRQEVFVNAGRKEHTAAKDLARLSLEQLRRELATYTVNRICTAICLEVAAAVARTVGQEAPTLRDVFQMLDKWAGDTGTRMALSVLWDQQIERLATDQDVPGAVLEKLDGERARAAGDPRALEMLAREIVSEAILSTRSFTRYVELMNSLLGGGALPTNQDPKGLMARGGTRATPFHLSINDRALEAFVAVLALEAADRMEPLSFQGLIDGLRIRYGLLVDTLPAGSTATSGMLAEAASQSREALRDRLHAMGLLQEFSDSSEWNRVTWRGQKS